MHIELFGQHEGVKIGAKNQWYWRTVNRGNTTAIAGKWDDRWHAARQARAHIVSCIKPYARRMGTPSVMFTSPKWDEKRRAFVIKWS